MIATKGEVHDIGVKGGGDHRDLEAKASGALAVGKELFTKDSHALLFGCPGHHVPKGGEEFFIGDAASHEERVNEFSPFARRCGVGDSFGLAGKLRLGGAEDGSGHGPEGFIGAISEALSWRYGYVG